MEVSGFLLARWIYKLESPLSLQKQWSISLIESQGPENHVYLGVYGGPWE